MIKMRKIGADDSKSDCMQSDDNNKRRWTQLSFKIWSRWATKSYCWWDKMAKNGLKKSLDFKSKQCKQVFNLWNNTYNVYKIYCVL